MRSFVTLGVLSLLGAAALAACGDDDPGPGAGGNGGSSSTQAGSGGSAGNSSMAGAAGNPNMGGMGGMGGQTADVTPQATCTGCVELIVPAVGPNSDANMADQVGFQFGGITPPADMTNGVITWRIAAVAPDANTFVTIYAQNGMPLNYAGAYLTVALAPATFAANAFVDVVFDLSSVGGAAGDAGAPDAAAADAGDGGGAPAGTPPTIVGTFDKAQIVQYGITVGVGNTFTGSTTVRVAVDSVTVVGVPGQASKTFDTTAEGLAINMYQVPPGTPQPVPHPAP